MLFLSPWFPPSCICTDYNTLSFYLNHIKRVIVSLIVYKWPLLLQITVTFFYAILRLLGNYKHKLYLSKACSEYPFTLLKPSKKAHQYHSDNRGTVGSSVHNIELLLAIQVCTTFKKSVQFMYSNIQRIMLGCCLFTLI